MFRCKVTVRYPEHFLEIDFLLGSEMPQVGQQIDECLFEPRLAGLLDSQIFLKGFLDGMNSMLLSGWRGHETFSLWRLHSLQKSRLLETKMVLAGEDDVIEQRDAQNLADAFDAVGQRHVGS